MIQLNTSRRAHLSTAHNIEILIPVQYKILTSVSADFIMSNITSHLPLHIKAKYHKTELYH